MAADELAPTVEVSAADAQLVRRLREGDAAAFEEIVDAWSPVMLRLARTYVRTQASAEEVVQDAWLAVLKGLDRFEGRSMLKTWVFRILANVAKTRAVQEQRTVPLSSLGSDDYDEDGPTVDPSRFQGPGDPQPGGWTSVGAPRPWPSPEAEILAAEVLDLVQAALEELPSRQREVVDLRDVHGLRSDEVCEILDISAANQRVLLHRGRAKVRSALEGYYREREEAMSP
jgi:RNA polymerase sigma-70 factor (ECF subfamily)